MNRRPLSFAMLALLFAGAASSHVGPYHSPGRGGTIPRRLLGDPPTKLEQRERKKRDAAARRKRNRKRRGW